MRKLLLIGICGLLGGCATPTDLRKDSADFSATSAMSVPDVVSCIVQNWESGTMTANISVRPLRDEGTSLMILGGYMQPIVLVDVRKSGQGSHIESFTAAPFLQSYIVDVRKCAT